MGKHRTRRPPIQEATPAEGGQARRSIVEVVVGARDSLLELSIETGLQVVEALLELDRVALCGPKGKHDPSRSAHRHGHDHGALVLGGRKVSVAKPRVRGKDGEEKQLATYEVLSAEDPLLDRVYEQMIVGVSTRKYARSLEPLPASVATKATSKSEVSRNFVARTQAQLEEFLQQPLSDLDLPIIMLDGVHFRDHVLLVALGIDRDGRKHVLGLMEGTTESERAGCALLRNLAERGLAVEQPRLFVIDGGRGLRRAIRTVFGAWALIARCQVHKLRNVADHLPQGKRAFVRAAMRKAYSSTTAGEAKKRLLQLASSLDSMYPAAASSVREGLDESLTVLELGVGPTLRRSVSSTNAIENLNGTLRHVSRRVKRWRGTGMVRRWAGSALVEAAKKFRRVKGYREMPGLIASLQQLCPALTEDDLDIAQERV